MPSIEVPAIGTDQSIIIQTAIDSLSRSGGGKVVLLAGRHFCGPLRLRSGVELNIAEDAVLEFTGSYSRLEENRVTVTAEGSDRALIVAQGQFGIAVSGTGEILAPGRSYCVGFDPEVGTLVPAQYRPRVLVLEDCVAVRISGIRIVDSPMWTVHLVGCTEVKISGLVIRNDKRLPNTDGVVIDSCSDVLVEALDISTADDGICLKTTERAGGVGEIAQVVVRDCRVSSQSCAFKIGTETFGNIRNVVFEDCEVLESNRALGIFSRDGGAICDVRFSRIRVDCRETSDGFWGSGEALTVNGLDRRTSRPAGVISGLVVEDITGTMEGAINLIAVAPAGIRNVRLSRISVTQIPGTLGTGQRYDLRPTPADLAVAADARGRANAWTKDAAGRIAGVLDYPTGLPALYAVGVSGLALAEVTIGRPTPIPAGWAKDPLFVTQVSKL